MRVTMDQDDPDYIGKGNFGRYRVTVDGFPVKGVTEADDQAGYVVAHKFDEAGAVVVDREKNEVVMVTHRGLVRIIDTRA